MKEETLQIRAYGSERSKIGNLIISARGVYKSTGCELVIGRPGQPNVERQMHLGDAVLYETPTDGILEIRVLGLDTAASATVLITQISPQPGFAGGLVDQSPSNSAFSDSERSRINESIAKLKDQLQKSSTFNVEQLDLINRKLDEIQSASERLGRKDWINYVAGTITALCISAAFAPDQAKNIFHALNAAFSWLFGQSPIFLQF